MAYSSDIPNNSVGKKLKNYFEQKGYSQQQIADILDVHQTNISALFLGKRPFGKNAAKKWNKAFGFRVNWLMTGEGPMFDADTTATPSTPLSASSIILEAPIPPIATTGMDTDSVISFNFSIVRFLAFFFVLVPKTAPTPM